MRIPRPGPTVAASAALHVVLGLVLARVLMEPGSLGWILPASSGGPPVEERIAYVAVAPPTPQPAAPLPPSRAGQRGGDGRVARPDARRSAAPLVAPTRVPSAVPNSAAAPARDDEEGGTGPLVGGGGPLRGVQPRYGDPRVWVPPGEVTPPAKSDIQRLDSAFAVRFKQHQDSMAIAARVRRPGDWTVAREDGSKYGIEPGNGGPPKLWLGRIAIPLPLAIGPQPGQLERERALRAITSDLAEQSTRRLTEDEFRKAVREIRQRKEWERSRAAEREKKGDAPESAPKGEPSGPRE
jgi:hypothetical protein